MYRFGHQHERHETLFGVNISFFIWQNGSREVFFEISFDIIEDKILFLIVL